MAITTSAAGAKVLLSTPFVMTSNEVTVTGDGTLITHDVAGIAHGGPTGATPIAAWATQTADSATGGDVIQVNVTGYDTTNDEVDVTLDFGHTDGTALANTETVKFKLYVMFSDQATGGIS